MCRKGKYLAKQLGEERQDVDEVNCLRDESGTTVVKPEMVRKRWKEYIEHLLKVDNVWDGMVEGGKVEGSRMSIRQMEVERPIRLTQFVSEIIRAVSQTRIKKVTREQMRDRYPRTES